MNNFAKIIIHLLVVLFIITRPYFGCTQKGQICNTFVPKFYDLTTQNIGEGADDLEFMGFMYITHQNLKELKHPFADNNYLRYPQGFNYSYGFDGAFPVLLGATLFFFFDLILAFNITVLLIFIINYIFAYYFFSKIKNLFLKEKNVNELNVFIASSFFALSPYVFARASSHLNLMFVAGFPMLSYFILKFYKSRKTIKEISILNYLGLFFSLLVIAAGSLQYLIILGYSLAILIICVYAFMFKRFMSLIFMLGKRFILFSIIPAFLALAAFMFIFWGYISGILTSSLALSSLWEKYSVAHPLDLIIPNPYLNGLFAVINPSQVSIENTIALGVSGLLILLFLFISKEVDLGYKILLVIFITIWVFTSLNVISFSFFPEGGRYIVTVSLLVSLGIVTTNINKKFLYAVMFIIFIERLLFGLNINSSTGYQRFQKVRDNDGEAVLNIPLSKYISQRTITPYLYNKKVPDGYFHYTAFNSRSDYNFDINSQSPLYYLDCNMERSINVLPTDDPEIIYELDNWLKENRFKTIVFYKENSGIFITDQRCANVLDFWNFYKTPVLYLSHDSGRVQNYEFNLIFNDKVDARFISTESGNLNITGIIVYPDTFREIKISGPNTERSFWDLGSQNGSKVLDLPEPVEIQMAPYSSALISLSGSDNKDTYLVKVYYSFVEENSEGIVIDENSGYTSRSLEGVYSDDTVDIFYIK